MERLVRGWFRLVEAMLLGFKGAPFGTRIIHGGEPPVYTSIACLSRKIQNTIFQGVMVMSGLRMRYVRTLSGIYRNTGRLLGVCQAFKGVLRGIPAQSVDQPYKSAYSPHDGANKAVGALN